MKKKYIFFGLVLLMIGQLGRPIELPINNPQGFYGLTYSWGIRYEDPHISGVFYHSLPTLSKANIILSDKEQTDIFLNQQTTTTTLQLTPYQNFLNKINVFCSERNLKC
jgi:hypothetical protein